MASHAIRISTLVLVLGAFAASPVTAQPAWRVAVNDINAANGVFSPGNPAQPGVDVETFGLLTVRSGPGPIGYNFSGFDVVLHPDVDIPAGLFDWGSTVEAFADPAIGGLMSGAGALVFDGDETADLRVHWTLGVSYDAPGPPPGPLVSGNANSIVRANARVQLTGLVPGALYNVSWEWESTGDADTATGRFNCNAAGNLSMLLDGAPLPGFPNPIASNSAVSNDGPPDSFMDTGDGAFSFVATPGFTCDRELTITVISSASLQSPSGQANELGLSTASTVGDLNLHIVKQSASPLETPGDVNCDGVVNGLDIEPFMTLLYSPEEYAVRFPCCPASNADLNLDDQVTFEDVALFASALVGS